MLEHNIERPHSLRPKPKLQRHSTKGTHSPHITDEEEEEEEMLQKQAPIKKGRKKTQTDPNKKDKLGRTRLFSATTAGHLERVKELIKQGANVNMKDNADWTPLHEAAFNARFEIADYLVSCGADINVRGYGLDTPLHDACQSNSMLCVKLLVDAGADVFALNENNKRPIDLCTTDECKMILTTKMEKLDHVIRRDGCGKTLLHHAAYNNEYSRVQDLIQQGADVNAKDNQESTPLHLAAAQGHADIVKLLFEQGALVDILGTEAYDSPLHQASSHGQKQIVVYLTSVAKADVNLKNKRGETPYDVSASFPSIRQHLTSCMDKVRLEKESCHALDDTARKLALQNEPERQLTREERKIQNYMRVFAKLQGENNNTKDALDDIVPLPVTTKRKKKPTVSRKSASIERELINSPTKKSFPKLDPFKKDSCGGTQLHKFASRGDYEMVESLLEAGAKPNEKDYAGWTALHEAALHGHIEVVKLLLKYGANVNSQGADMDTPLHDATENNHCEIVELLLEHGADPFARNIKNAEPIDIATMEGYQDIILVLENANPVKKKKRPKVQKGDITDVQSNSNITTTTTTKKRRLVQAASLEKNKYSDDDEEQIRTTKTRMKKAKVIALVEEEDSEEEEEEEEEEVVLKRPTKLKKLRQRSCSPELITVKLEEEVIHKPNIITKENKSNHIPTNYDNIPSIDNHHHPQHQQQHPYHSPIHTPPPEQWTKQKQLTTTHYSPLYIVQITSNSYPSSSSLLYYVVDLQVCLFLGLSNLDDFWKQYQDQFSHKKPIHQEGKARLWSTLKYMIHEDKSKFIARQLSFITLDDVVTLIKRDYKHLSQSLLTITLDIDYDEIENNKKYCNLPPKIAMKMRKCGYQHYNSSK